MNRSIAQTLLGVVASITFYFLLRVVTRVFAPANRSDLLTDEEMAGLKDVFERVEHRAHLVTLCMLVVPMVSFTLGLSFLNDQVFFPAINAVYDGRRWEWWCGSGLVMSLSLGFWLHWRIVRRRTGPSFTLYVQFATTRDQSDPKKNMIVWTLMLLLMAIPFGWAGWNNGIVVDQRGIAVRMGWYSASHTYDDVVRIERFTAKRSADGEATPREGVRVRFCQGVPVRIYEKSQCRYSAGLDAIAEYVSERSSVAITRQSREVTPGDTG